MNITRRSRRGRGDSKVGADDVIDRFAFVMLGCSMTNSRQRS
jgi:hypothetical protein